MDPAGAGRGTICIVPILLLLAAVVIFAGVVSVAMGHGGEMAEFAMRLFPARPGRTPPMWRCCGHRPQLWGYNAQVTDEALNRIAQVITERDVEIAVLRQQLAELRSAHRQPPGPPATLLARSKAASARSPGPEAALRPAARGPYPGGRRTQRPLSPRRLQEA